MNNMSLAVKIYILGTILLGARLMGWMVVKMDWTNMGVVLLAVLGAVAQTLNVEGPNAKTNYSIAWIVHGFVFIACGPAAAIFVVVIAHLVEWAWHKYPWYIQSFNIGSHVLAVYLAGLVFTAGGQDDEQAGTP
jgi:hypothetical protein